MRRLYTATAACCAIFAALAFCRADDAAPGGSATDWEEVRLTLDGLMRLKGRHLDGTWHPVVSISKARISGKDAWARLGLLEADPQSEAIRLRLDALLWIPGEREGRRVNVRIDAQRGPNRKLTGTYSGTSGELALSGEVHGEIHIVWPTRVADWVSVDPGEHPRLIFRRSDLPDLRRRAVTVEGARILQCTKQLLSRSSYSVWHPAGYAFLYCATGRAVWLDKCHGALDDTLRGRRSPDSRYDFTNPTGQLRAGPAIAAIALAYDMAYEGLDARFRQELARRIQDHPLTVAIVERPDYGPGEHDFGAHQGSIGTALLSIRGDPGVDADRVERWFLSVLERVKREISHGYGERGYYYEGHGAGRVSSNSGIVPFIQACRIAAGLDFMERSSNARWLFTRWAHELARQGSEGDQSGTSALERGVLADTGLGPYGPAAAGDFCQGFGICPDRYKAAMLWVYNHIVDPRPTDRKDYDVRVVPHHGAYALANWPLGMEEQHPTSVLARTLHDPGPGYIVTRNAWSEHGDIVVSVLLGSEPAAGRGMASGGGVELMGMGLRAEFPAMFYQSKLGYAQMAEDGSTVLTAVPITANPADLLGLHRRDDVISALLTRSPEKTTIGKETLVSVGDLDGSEFRDRFNTAVRKDLTRGVSALAIDFSGRCGAPALLAMTGPYLGKTIGRSDYVSNGKRQTRIGIRDAAGRDLRLKDGTNTRVRRVIADGLPYCVMTLQSGDAPKVSTRGNRLIVGGVSVHFDGVKMVLEEVSDGSRPIPGE